MANQEHVDILMQGVEVWNAWREANPNVRIDLRRANLRRARLSEANLFEADLSEADLSEADLFMANLIKADLIEANLVKANLSGANLYRANLFEAELSDANLSKAELSDANLVKANLVKANLSEASLTGANLLGANLSKANLSLTNLSLTNLTAANLVMTDLSGADLGGSILVQTILDNANLMGCRIYGISAWDVKLDGAKQSDLIISKYDEPDITVDNLEVAQFIYLLLHNEKIRDVIQTIGKKAVLILGRFTPERKAILDAIREALRHKNYIPIVFDFEKPANRDLKETINTLAHLSRFIIADITDAKSIPLELLAVVPNLLSVAVQPIIQTGFDEFGMFESIARYPSVLPIHSYDSQEALIAELSAKVIEPAEKKAGELMPLGK